VNFTYFSFYFHVDSGWRLTRVTAEGKERHAVTDESPGALVDIDPTVPHSARVHDFLLGGSDNFAVDREAARRIGELLGGLDHARAEARAHRAFLARAVRWLAAEAGIRQFLDIGAGIPMAGAAHTIALRAAPDARVVAVDRDPVVLAHAHRLLRDGRDGATRYLQADLREPAGILAKAAATLDFSAPVAVLLVGVLHHVSDHHHPAGVVARLVRGLAQGSYVAISHIASDIQPVEVATAAAELGRILREPWVPRDRDAVRRLFPGLHLVEPGLVQVDEWRRAGTDPPRPGPGRWVNPIHAGVGRKG
jgi:SAM-dependent methyltransferase